jgi:hypothetical protein
MDEELGPFQEIWDAWDEAHGRVRNKPLPHYQRALEIQFEELEGHLRADDHDRASREAIDIISVALNLLRWLGHQPPEINDLARSRADQRMKGQAHQILDKYQRIYGI